MAEIKAVQMDHKLVLHNQQQMDITGISRVESFNPEEIHLETDFGLVAIKGEDLDMRNLNLEQGVVEIIGVVTEILYTGEKAGSSGRKGFFERIFK